MKGGRKVTSVPTTYRPIERVLPRLQRVREVGPGRWIACCPAHNDRSPSLAIREAEGGKVLLRCWAGCPTAEVLAVLGLTWQDLFPEGSRHTRVPRECKPSSEEITIRKIADRFDRACIHAHRRLSVFFRVVGWIFATYGLNVTQEEAEWIRDLAYMEVVLDWLLSAEPEVRLAGLRAAQRWLT